MLGADVANPEPRVFNDLEVELWPRVSWSPFFAVTFSDLKVGSPFSALSMASRAQLFCLHLLCSGTFLRCALASAHPCVRACVYVSV